MCGTQEQKDKVSGASEYAKDRLVRDYYQTKYSAAATSGQHNFGQASGDMYDSFQMGMEGVGDFFERNTRSLRPQSDDDQGNDTAEMNYSTSGVSKSSSGVGKKADLKDKKDKKTQGPSRTFTIKNK